MSETLLQVENLRTYFHTFRGVVKAVEPRPYVGGGKVIPWMRDRCWASWASRAAVNPLAAFPF